MEHYANHIPNVLKQCFVKLEDVVELIGDFFDENEMFTENDIQAEIEALNQGELPDFNYLVACTLLKHFLDLLPDSLIPRDYFKTAVDKTHTDWIRIIRRLRTDNPKHYAVYDYFFYHFNQMIGGKIGLARVLSGRLGLSFVRGKEQDFDFFREAFGDIIYNYSQIKISAEK